MICTLYVFTCAQSLSYLFGFFYYRNAFQNALRIDGEYSTTALSVAVWNRKPQVIYSKAKRCIYVYTYLTLVSQVVGMSIYLVITMLWPEPGWQLHGHVTPPRFGSDVMQFVTGHVTP